MVNLSHHEFLLQTFKQWDAAKDHEVVISHSDSDWVKDTKKSKKVTEQSVLLEGVPGVFRVQQGMSKNVIALAVCKVHHVRKNFQQN